MNSKNYFPLGNKTCIWGKWHPTPVLLLGKSHGWKSLVGCSPWGRKESDTTEQLHFSLFTFMHWRRKWQPTPVFLPGESQGRGSLVGCRLWGHTESDTTEATQQQLVGKESTCQCRRPQFNSWARIHWRRDRLPTPVFLGLPCGSASKESACNVGDLGSIPGLGDPLEKGKATHSSILAWRIPWTVHEVAKSRT